MAIALTDDVRVNSQPQYFAQYRSGNEALDLAVVQIVEDINGNRVSAADLKLMPAKIGNSDELNMGDEINLLGYPGVGGEPSPLQPERYRDSLMIILMTIDWIDRCHCESWQQWWNGNQQ